MRAKIISERRKNMGAARSLFCVPVQKKGGSGPLYDFDDMECSTIVLDSF